MGSRHHDRFEIGYCTNVHAGNSLEHTRANLSEHAVAVREQWRKSEPMGLGLWLSAAVAERLTTNRAELTRFAQFLQSSGLQPFTLNGFPFGDFHRPVVKHDVYFPTWWDPRRTAYTLRLADLLPELLPAGLPGTISTLPISWGSPPPDAGAWRAAAEQLLRVARHLYQREQQTGCQICLCLEPEPGCALQRSSDVVRFFTEYLWPLDRDLAGRYLGVCHDICHSAVMFEPQADAFRAYQQAGIRVGKIQVSAAVAAPLAELSATERHEALAQLRAFTEDRYLHQTIVRTTDGRELAFEDLPLALGYQDGLPPAGEQWRVHFHVPIFAERFGFLRSTQSDILQAVIAALRHSDVTHFEVETYAWNVLPEALRQTRLADGIVRELAWFRQQLDLALADGGDPATAGE